MTEEFDDLKKGQEALTKSGQNQTMVHDAEKGGGEIEISRRKLRGGRGRCVACLYKRVNIARANVIDAVQSWMTEAGRTIAIFPSKRSVNRRRTVNFVNKMKVLLRKTKPIGEDEGKEDAEWLGTWVSELPEEPAASAVALFEVGAGAASPLHWVLRNVKLANTGKKGPAANSICHSTPESTAKERAEKTKKGGKNKSKKEKKTNEVPPLDLEEKTITKKAKEEIDERLVAATAMPPNDTIDLAIEHDANMKALVDKAKTRRDELREETRKVEEEEERLKDQKKREEEEEEEEKVKEEREEEERRLKLQKHLAQRLQEILDDIAVQEKRLKEKKAISTKSVENLKKGIAEDEKKKEAEKEEETSSSSKSSSDSDDESEPKAKEVSWQEVRSKSKRKQKVRKANKTKSVSSSSSNSSDSEEERSPKKGRKKGSLRRVRMEALARERLHESQPKIEAEKYGDDEKVNYRMFKAKFQSFANVKCINYLVVLNELPNWLRGAPKRLTEAFNGAKKPESGRSRHLD